MPLDVDSCLPGCLFWFSREKDADMSFIGHVDTCTSMSTGNLNCQKWLITQFPHIVVERIQCNDAQPFDPVQLSIAIADVADCANLANELTAIIHYWTPCANASGEPQVMSFGLGASIAINTLVGLPQLHN